MNWTPKRRWRLRPHLGKWPCAFGWHWGDLCWFCERRVKWTGMTEAEIAQYKEWEEESR